MKNVLIVGEPYLSDLEGALNNAVLHTEYIQTAGEALNKPAFDTYVIDANVNTKGTDFKQPREGDRNFLAYSRGVALVDYIHQRRPSAKIIVLGIPPKDETGDPAGFNRRLRCLYTQAAGGPTTFADIPISADELRELL